MAPHTFQYNYHDSRIQGIQIGPRQEVILDISLDSIWNGGESIVARLRFGGIQNYAEVSTYFHKIPTASEERMAVEIASLKKTGKQSWSLELDPAGVICIKCLNAEESRLYPVK